MNQERIFKGRNNGLPYLIQQETKRKGILINAYQGIQPSGSRIAGYYNLVKRRRIPASINRQFDIRRPTHGKIWTARIHVEEEDQKQGLSRTLIEVATEILQEQGGLHLVTLTTIGRTRIAPLFYTKGYEEQEAKRKEDKGILLWKDYGP